jgi:hypothetical protein
VIEGMEGKVRDCEEISGNKLSLEELFVNGMEENNICAE